MVNSSNAKMGTTLEKEALAMSPPGKRESHAPIERVPTKRGDNMCTSWHMSNRVSVVSRRVPKLASPSGRLLAFIGNQRRRSLGLKRPSRVDQRNGRDRPAVDETQRARNARGNRE